jgi:hypothetical protein
MLEITGDWLGYYTYGDGYEAWQRQQQVPFRMTIQRGISEFVGRIFEEAEYGGIDDEIVIKGRQNGDDIEFTKYYSREHFSDDQGNLVSFESDSPTIVYYKGTFDSVEQKFSGTWEITGLREDDDGIFHEDNLSGTWSLWREP